MRPASITAEDHAAAIAPAASRMPWRVAAVEALPDYRLHVRFQDGLEGEVAMRRMIFAEDAGVFVALRDEAMFAAAFVEFGSVTWPNELDLAPDAMHAEIKKNGVWNL